MSELERAFSIEDTVEDREQIIDDLMHQHGDDILHLVYTYVKNRTIAEDLTQEILLNAMRSWINSSNNLLSKHGPFELPVTIARIT